MRTASEFRALLVLLADEDDRVSSVAWAALAESGDAAVPYLRESTNSPDTRLRGRARFLLDEIRFRALEERWRLYAARPDEEMDLEEGCLLLARLHGDGAPDEDAVRRFLDAMAGMVRAAIPHAGGLHALGEVLFDNLGFRGGDFDNPGSHYLPGVLERRVGIPISLCAVYVLVGRRAGLPVSGVAMPGQFLARFDGPGGPIFVDCYNRGRLYGHAVLAGVLESKGLRPAERYLAPCSTRFALFRMMNNLEHIYQDGGDTRMVDLVRRLREHLGLNAEGDG